MKTPISAFFLLLLLWSCADDDTVHPPNPKKDQTTTLSFTVDALDTTVMLATHFYINFNVPVDSLPADIKIMAGNHQLSIEQAFDSTYVVAVTEEKGEYDITLTHKDTTLTLGKVRTAAFGEIAPVDIGYVAVNDTMYAGAFDGTAIQFSANTFSFKNDTLEGVATFYENGLPEIIVIGSDSYYLTNYTESTVDIYDLEKPFEYQSYFIKDFLRLFGETPDNSRVNQQDIALHTKMAMLPFLMAVAQISHFGVRFPSSDPYIHLPREVPELYDRFHKIVTDLEDWQRWLVLKDRGKVSAALIWATHYYNTETDSNHLPFPSITCSTKCMYSLLVDLTQRLYRFYLDGIKSALEAAKQNSPKQFDDCIVWGQYIFFNSNVNLAFGFSPNLPILPEPGNFKRAAGGYWGFKDLTPYNQIQIGFQAIAPTIVDYTIYFYYQGEKRSTHGIISLDEPKQTEYALLLNQDGTFEFLNPKAEGPIDFVTIEYGSVCHQNGNDAYVVNSHPDKSISVRVKVSWEYEFNEIRTDYIDTFMGPGVKSLLGCTVTGGIPRRSVKYEIETASWK